jgi:hypothetical protein
VPEPFAPQLVLFVAGPQLVPLYREFIYPLVPRRTGLLAMGLEDVQVGKSENEPIAIEIALTRAGVVVYDEGGRSRVPLDYVRMVRGGSPLVLVTAPESTIPEDTSGPSPTPGPKLDRPTSMSGWPHSFVEPLLEQIRNALPVPDPAQVDQYLSLLVQEKDWPRLLLTGLALLERLERDDTLRTTPAPATPTSGTMEAFEAYFGSDFPAVIEAVELRHDLLQNAATEPGTLEGVATAVAEITRRRWQAIRRP